MNTSDTSSQATLTQTPNRIVATGPVVAVIVPLAVTIPVVLPEPLAGDLRRLHARLDAIDERAGFKRLSLDEWLIEILKDVVYGHGAEPGAAQDWIER